MRCFQNILYVCFVHVLRICNVFKIVRTCTALKYESLNIIVLGFMNVCVSDSFLISFMSDIHLKKYVFLFQKTFLHKNYCFFPISCLFFNYILVE